MNTFVTHGRTAGVVSVVKIERQRVRQNVGITGGIPLLPPAEDLVMERDTEKIIVLWLKRSCKKGL